MRAMNLQIKKIAAIKYPVVACQLTAPNSPMQGEAPQIAAELSEV
jgi:hypothetical protein